MQRNLVAVVFLGLCLLPSVVWGQSSTQQQIDALQRQLDQLRAATQVSPSDKAGSVSTMPVPTVPSEGVGSVPTAISAEFAPGEYVLMPAAQAAPAPQGLLAPIASIAPPAAKEKTFPDFKLTGFFQLDSAYFGQSVGNRNALGDIQDGVGFRRARLAATGNITENGSYLMEYDMAQGQARFVDVWGQVKDTPLGTMRIGRYRQPYGMTELTGIREIPFLERPTPFALSPFRQTGIMFSDTAFEESLTWAVSGFRTFSDNFGNVYGDNGGYGLAERVTFLAMDQGDTGLLHFGLDYSYLDPGRDEIGYASQDEISLTQQPVLGPGGLSVLPIVFVPPFVNTGVFNVNHVNMFNVEAAASLGRALVQSEYRWNRVSLPTGEDATVHAGYITARYMLTGETIPYNRTSGLFGRVKPDCPVDIAKGQWGAWEIAARLSTINLNPLFGLVPGPTRRLTSFDLGLNWYLWNQAKAQLNWVNGSLNDPLAGNSVNNTAAARVQFDF